MLRLMAQAIALERPEGVAQAVGMEVGVVMAHVLFFRDQFPQAPSVFNFADLASERWRRAN